MLQYIVVILFIILAFSGFLAALHFSRYKKRASSGCCGGEHCSTDEGERYNSCYNEKIDFVDNFKKPKEA